MARKAVEKEVVPKMSGEDPLTGRVTITAPNFQTAVFNIKGTAPFVQLRFSKKGDIMEHMAKGPQASNRRDRKARDYEAEYQAAKHISTEGWQGIPASSFRNAMISACRIAKFKMTLAKLAVFVVADGIDVEEGTPLVKLHGKSEMCSHHVRNDNGSLDIRVRSMTREWAARVAIQFDADIFTHSDITNLLARVGLQVGLGEGRPDSKNSGCGGMGWGTFVVV